MKSRKGKTMRKAGGYIYICDINTTDTGLRVVSYPGLRWQDTRLGGQMEQVKSVWYGKTNQGETSAQGEGDKLAADQIVVAWNGL
jgi:hypothetical protein